MTKISFPNTLDTIRDSHHTLKQGLLKIPMEVVQRATFEFDPNDALRRKVETFYAQKRPYTFSTATLSEKTGKFSRNELEMGH